MARKAAEAAFRKCIEAVDPRTSVAKAIRISNHRLVIENSTQVPLTDAHRLVLIGFGKAVIGMMRGAQEALGGAHPAFLIAPKQFDNADIDATAFYAAAGNLPDDDSVTATNFIVRQIDEFDSRDTVFVFLVSGGGSALLCAPIDGIELRDKLATIKLLTSKGATIQQLNRIRQKLSKVKGGRLLGHIKQGKAVSLIISDVIGDNLELIASGSTVPRKHNLDPLELFEILKSCDIEKTELNPNILRKLEEIENVPNTTSCETFNYIISSNRVAVEAVKKSLTNSGYEAHVITSNLVGNATQLGKMFANLIKGNRETLEERLSQICSNHPKIDSSSNKIALIFGGETTVILKGNGKGGRNQEMVLSCFNELRDHSNFAWDFTFLSAGTDGQDGPTDAAGAIISSQDLQSVEPNPIEFLNNSDSYTFWSKFRNGANHIISGSTGTNVMDVQLVLLDKR
ncbi:unnamed protein product [Caenorhabditis bovis]|uniref:Glycerate kinase n=1 Tax=Caenorhabditis bovis TaxID=2654633 RepID=A0A8S1EPX9_9PELO|nr:unnamed protein product [Caenorhabditis bovis]